MYCTALYQLSILFIPTNKLTIISAKSKRSVGEGSMGDSERLENWLLHRKKNPSESSGGSNRYRNTYVYVLPLYNGPIVWCTVHATCTRGNGQIIGQVIVLIWKIVSDTITESGYRVSITNLLFWTVLCTFHFRSEALCESPRLFPVYLHCYPQGMASKASNDDLAVQATNNDATSCKRWGRGRGWNLRGKLS